MCIKCGKLMQHGVMITKPEQCLNIKNDEIAELKDKFSRATKDIIAAHDTISKRNTLITDLRGRFAKANKNLLEMGHIIRRLDENCEYIEYWTQDGEYIQDIVNT